MTVGLLRVPKVETDILVTINAPVENDAELADVVSLANGKGGERLAARTNLCETVIGRMVSSLKVHDWGLFG